MFKIIKVMLALRGPDAGKSGIMKIRLGKPGSKHRIVFRIKEIQGVTGKNASGQLMSKKVESFNKNPGTAIKR